MLRRYTTTEHEEDIQIAYNPRKTGVLSVSFSFLESLLHLPESYRIVGSSWDGLSRALTFTLTSPELPCREQVSSDLELCYHTYHPAPEYYDYTKVSAHVVVKE